MTRRPTVARAGRPLTGLALTGLAALTALVLAGCSTPRAADPGSADNAAGSPGSDGNGAATQPVGDEWDVEAAWLAGGSLIALVTYGSSSCTPFVDDVLVDDGVLVVSLLDDVGPDTACTDDLVPRGTVIGVPEGVDSSADLELQVSYGDAFAEVELDGYAGGTVEEYTPSAGWAGDDHIAILTWGSSSCAPAVESVVVESADSVAVTFVAPPENQVCTMDMAPRVAVAAVEGEVSRDATLNLSGGAEFADGMAIPIG